MIVKILGLIDIVVGISFWLFGIFHLKILAGFILIMGLFLLAKGIAFAAQLSIASILDIASAFLIASATYTTFPNIVIIIISLFLIQKGVFSIIV
ncbi:hypothetical protein GF386_01045 [Candidatus Pacearchaeota archaeon]|nr:hypothetical protein [Candidatus Pacearchaeota archaeon]MBD3282820.1 hypothetical protein [Candidatus Pacearchaeota archaeon]